MDLTHCLIDAQQMHKEHPESFSAPSDAELDNIKLGDIVKVCDSKERFWTKVQSVNNDKITATIDNDLLGMSDKHNCNYGDSIVFEKRHIYAIYNMF